MNISQFCTFSLIPWCQGKEWHIVRDSNVNIQRCRVQNFTFSKMTKLNSVFLKWLIPFHQYCQWKWYFSHIYGNKCHVFVRIKILLNQQFHVRKKLIFSIILEINGIFCVIFLPKRIIFSAFYGGKTDIFWTLKAVPYFCFTTPVKWPFLNLHMAPAKKESLSEIGSKIGCPIIYVSQANSQVIYNLAFN